jgi:hypothetical protein
MDIVTKYVPRIFDFICRKAFINKYGKVSTSMVAIASFGPLVASLLWRYSHTAIEVTDGQQVRWVHHWLAQRPDVIRRLRHLTLTLTDSMIGSIQPSCHRITPIDDPDGTEERKVFDSIP